MTRLRSVCITLNYRNADVVKAKTYGAVYPTIHIIYDSCTWFMFPGDHNRGCKHENLSTVTFEYAINDVWAERNGQEISGTSLDYTYRWSLCRIKGGFMNIRGQP